MLECINVRGEENPLSSSLQAGNQPFFTYYFGSITIMLANGSVSTIPPNESITNQPPQSNLFTMTLFEDPHNGSVFVNVSFNFWDMYNATKLFGLDLATGIITDLDKPQISGIFPFILPAVPPNNVNYILSSCPNASLAGSCARRGQTCRKNINHQLGYLMPTPSP